MIYYIYFTNVLGYDCKNVKDGCRQNPCLVGQECFKLTVSEQKQLGRSYRCGPCTAGYSENGTACVGR